MHATPVDDRNFASVVREASKKRWMIVAFLERDDDRLADLQLISIDRAGCFHLAVADPQAEALLRSEWWLTEGAVWAFRDAAPVISFDGETLVDDLRDWLETEMPREAERFANQGDWSAAAGDPQAMEHYTTALACDPSNPRALLGLARLHVVRGDSSGALALATRVARDGPLGDQAERLTEELRHHVDPEGAEAALRGRLAMNFGDREAARQLEEMEARRRKHHG